MKIFADYIDHSNARIDNRIFWDIDHTKLDYQKCKKFIVERVAEWGRHNDYYAILNLYGEDEVREIIKKCTCFPEFVIEFVCEEFEIPLYEMQSYSKNRPEWRIKNTFFP